MNDLPSRSMLRTNFAISFFLLAVGLLGFNYWSFQELTLSKQNHQMLVENLDQEESNLQELQFLESRHNKLAIEYKMLDDDLKKYFQDECYNKSNFEPVFTDLIVTNVFENSNLDAKLASIFYVPEIGKHRLRVKATVTKFPTMGGTSRRERKTLFDESVALVGGSTNYMEVLLSKDRMNAKILIDDVERFRIPLGKPVARRPGIEVKGAGQRIVSSPNQAFYTDGSIKGPRDFAQVFFVMLYDSEANGNKEVSNLKAMVQLARKMVRLDFYIESDGPKTGSPDDPQVVRFLLHNYNRGVKPEFTFNEETRLYEFK